MTELITRQDDPRLLEATRYENTRYSDWMLLVNSLDAALAREAPTENYWDQNSVQCGNCSVEILSRKGSIPENNALSKPDIGSEDEHLCGRCAGHQMYVYEAELADGREQQQRLREALEAKSVEWDRLRDSHVARIWELERTLHESKDMVQINRARRDLGYMPDPDWCYVCARPKNDCACALAKENTPHGR